MLADQQLQLADELGARAKREISLDPLLEGFEPKLLEPSDLGLRPGLVGELGQRLSSPERERLPQHPVRFRRGGSPRTHDELLEPQQVERPRIGTELVRRGGGPDHDAAQHPAELRDVLLQDLRRGGGRSSAPQILDQAVTRHELVRVEEQDREQRPRFAAFRGTTRPSVTASSGPRMRNSMVRPGPEATPALSAEQRGGTSAPPSLYR